MFEFDHVNEAEQFLVEKLSSERFLNSANDMSNSSSFVAPYPPEQQIEAKAMVGALVSDLKMRGVTAAVADAYDTVLAILDEEDLWEPLCDIEGDTPKAELIQVMRDAADLQTKVAPRIEAVAKHADLLIVTGMGACYPFLRTHRLLEVLNPGVPTLVMFPGRHTEKPDGSTSLDVLATPAGQGGGNYRARNVFDM